MSGSQVVSLQMVENARSVNAKLLTRKLGATETNIVLNMFAGFVFPKCGSKHRVNHEKLLNVINVIDSNRTKRTDQNTRGMTT